MTTLRRARLVPVVALVLLSAAAAAQEPVADPLAAAKDLYAGASYADALALLEKLKAARPAADQAFEIEKYRAFCLFGAGRLPEAEQAMAAMVEARPRFRLGESDASPRLQAAYREVRGRVLPDVARAAYRRGAEAYHARLTAEATERLTLVVDLLKDPDMPDVPDRLDLEALATGFLSLIAASAAPLPATRVVQTPMVPAPRVREVYSADDPGVVPPVALETPTPPWPSGAPRMDATGVLELLIDERGSVASVVVRQSVNILYDRQLAEAARGWRYEPARIGSRRVRYLLHVQVRAGALQQPPEPGQAAGPGRTR